MLARWATGPRVAMLAGYVLLSSFFGLSFVSLVNLRFGEAIGFFWAVWTTSIAADIVFVIGTVAAGIAAWETARRSTLGGIAVGFLASWIVYAASYLVLAGPYWANASGDPIARDIPEAVAFVVQWGWAGLAFASIAPVVDAAKAGREDDVPLLADAA